MTVSVGAIGAVGSGVAPVYSLSPYLNGVIRVSDAASAAQLQAVAAAKSAAATAAAIAARGAAAASATSAPPFANPAIVSIANSIALGQSLIPPQSVTPDAQLSASDVTPTVTPTVTTAPAAAAQATQTTATTQTATSTTDATATQPAQQPQAPQQPSPTDTVLHGDSGEVIQAYGAVALLTGPVALTALYGLPQGPAVPPVAPVTTLPRVAPLETSA